MSTQNETPVKAFEATVESNQSEMQAESASRNRKYLESEAEIVDSLRVLNKKQKKRYFILCATSITLLLIGMLGIILNGSLPYPEPITKIVIITSFAFLFIAAISAIAVPLTTVNSKYFDDQLRSVQKEFIASYGLEITDFELARLNFPRLDTPKTEGLCGVADVFRTKTKAFERVALRVNSSGEFVLFDESGKALTLDA